MMSDRLDSEGVNVFSPVHRRFSWYLLQFLASLPGLLFMIGYFVPAVVASSIFLIVIFGDPFLRKLIMSQKLVRSIVFSTMCVYFGTALLSEHIPILALPFLILSACVLVIYFGRKVKNFESTVLKI